MNATKKVLTVGVMGVGVLLLTAWGGKSPYGQKPGYPGKPKKGPGGSSTWGDVPSPSALPDFDFAGNGIYISADCEYVIEGNQFWGARRAEEFPTVLETLMAPGDDPKNSIQGWIDYLLNQEGVTDPQVIVERFMREVSPFCWDVAHSSGEFDPETWGVGMRNWFENFFARVMDHVATWEGSIG
jgi:hypothetical protein